MGDAETTQMETWSRRDLNGAPLAIGRSLYFLDTVRRGIDKLDLDSSSWTFLDVIEEHETKNEFCLLMKGEETVYLLTHDEYFTLGIGDMETTEVEKWSRPDLHGAPLVIGRSLYFLDVVRRGIDKLDLDSSSWTFLDVIEEHETKNEFCLLMKGEQTVYLLAHDGKCFYRSQVPTDPESGQILYPVKVSQAENLTALEVANDMLQSDRNVTCQIKHVTGGPMAFSQKMNVSDEAQWLGLREEDDVLDVGVFLHYNRCMYLYQPQILHLFSLSPDFKIIDVKRGRVLKEVWLLPAQYDYDLYHVAVSSSNNCIYTVYSHKNFLKKEVKTENDFDRAQMADAKPEFPLLMAFHIGKLVAYPIHLGFSSTQHIPCIDCVVSTDDQAIYISGKCKNFPSTCKDVHIFKLIHEPVIFSPASPDSSICSHSSSEQSTNECTCGTSSPSATFSGICSDCLTETAERWTCAECSSAFCAACAVKLHQHGQNIFKEC
ncbi:hypothetical protein QR680_004054 [Steinernema hermaphroditum]|uniref:GATA-type domain-containing protein n=1 Tax=Steinernema hermaphroditum TaxID=289476 RepID=A0AA39HMH9_9BILA|nr:hypothetical protein QR680_004054 [Steinernema hermaphroditum]